uniref:F-box only protein 39-like n=1 Tax=Scatophagus argus TaxID=75038 RepID=UPI001ED7EC31|nr:F-box only protein 39-like [Scatophagus argus]
MDEDFVPLRNREASPWEEGFSEEDEDSVDLTDKGHECTSERASSWGLLPHVCLRHVFRFLCDHDRMSADLVCRHWHHVMHSPSLWRSRFFYFSGQRQSRSRQAEYWSAVTYARSLGAYLEKLEVCVCPPHNSLMARRLEQALIGLLSELTRLNAPLRILSIVRLELDRTSWTLKHKNSLVNCLINFLHRGSSRLTSVCLNGMRNGLHQGLELLSALAHSQMHRYPQCYISSLDLRGFFSDTVRVPFNFNIPHRLRHLQGLTDLSMNYSCLSDELLNTLQCRHRGWRWQFRRDANTLQTFSLYCAWNEPHEQLVCGDSWASLKSSSPDLKVRFTVDQVIDTNQLARILLPEILLTEYTMTAFYSPDTNWSARPVLCEMLPWYRCSLQYLTLDLSNCNESLDEELLQLVTLCECLKQLKVWAFLEISTAQRLLHIRLTQRKLLNKIRVRMYSVLNDIEEQEDQLEEILSSYLPLPPELEFLAIVYPFLD